MITSSDFCTDAVVILLDSSHHNRLLVFEFDSDQSICLDRVSSSFLVFDDCGKHHSMYL